MEAQENQETKQYPDIPFAQSTRRLSTRRLGMERASLKGGKEEEWKAVREAEKNQKTKASSTKALWYPDLPWGLPSKIAKAPEKGMLFLKFWDVISALLSIYVAWSIPFMLGFDKM
jgi:hypothetical protein